MVAESAPGSLTLLLVEDSAVDAELIIDALQQAGYHASWRRVEGEVAYRAALDQDLPDAILSDWTLPGFSGRAALEIARERCPEVPFLYVTGTTEESCAIEALRQGANDFVYKHQLAVLGAALARLLAVASERRHHLRAEADRHRLSEALCQTLQPVFLTDIDATITFVNPAFTHLVGFGVEEMRGQSVARLCPDAASRAQQAGILRQVRQTGNWSGELQCLTRDGISVPVFASIGVVCAADGVPEGFVGNYFDLRPLRDSEGQRAQLERQLHQSQKMDAIGQLTGGIAHDFNNLLGVLIGNLDLLRERLLDDSEGLELTDAALDAALRGAELNKRLLASARRQPLQPKRVEVGDSLADIVTLLTRSLGERVEVAQVSEPECWPIKVDPSQFENAIVNLGVNARDAMPDGGRLTIDCRNLAADHDVIGLPPGDYVVISVTDSGCGMNPEVLAHVFEPFYTTKEVGKGTGLGLSMVYGFVNQSGGQVGITSAPDQGTTMSIGVEI